MPKTIVCFGDSNTWGYVPGSDGERFGRDVRWPALLATALDGEAEVIAEGLNGRTATIESPVEEGRNGLPYLVPCLRSHAPVDLLVIYLGTNDASWLEPMLVARSVGRLVKVARAAEAGPERRKPRHPRRLPATVPRLRARTLVPRGVRAARLRAARPRRHGARYSDLDGIHLDETGHRAVAAAVEERVQAASRSMTRERDSADA